MRIVGILFAVALAVSLVLVPAAVLAQGGQGAGLAKGEWDPWPKWWDNPVSHDLYLQHWGRTPIQAMSRLGGLCGPSALCAGKLDPQAGKCTDTTTLPSGVMSWWQSREVCTLGHTGIELGPIATSCPGIDKSPIYGDPNACPGGCTACRNTEPGAGAICSDPVACTKSLSDIACAATGQSEYKCPSTPVFENKLPTCGGCWGVSLAFADKSWAGADIGTNVRINNNHPAHLGTSECTGGGTGGDWGLTGAPHTEHCALTWALQDNCFSGEKCAPN